MDDTNRFAYDLLWGIKKFLYMIGIPYDILDKLDVAIYLVIILVIAFVTAYVAHKATLYFTRRILKIKNIHILSSLIEFNAIRKLSYILPPLIVSGLLPFAFENNTHLLGILERITWIWFVAALVWSANAVLSSVGKVILSKSQLHNRPMKGFIQIIQVLFSFLGVVVIVSILIGKSPFNLITGLGAFAAVLMLIFKDTILGFVGGVLLAKNDMVNIGDWIEMSSSSVNGVVIDVSLTVVKVRNFDNTIVTVPPYSLISGSFINWQGMKLSGGRRIMREYNLKLDYIKPCTPEFLDRLKTFDTELAHFINTKQQQAAEGKVVNTENPEGLVNGTIDTNAGLLRAYMTIYLKRHPLINQELDLMVRTLAPTENGLPLQIYCFSSNKVWPSYESIQAEIMEHFVSVLPVFELYPFQSPSSRDYIINGLLKGGYAVEHINGVPWGTMHERGNTL